MVHGELEELPQHADGHGEAEGGDRHEEGGQVEGHLFLPIEDIHQGEADGGAEEAVHGVEHGVPAGIAGIIGLDLPQNFGGVDEQEDDNLQGVGQINMKAPLKHGGQHEQHQGEDAQQHVLIVLVEELGHQHEHHRQPQDEVHGVDQFFVLDVPPLLAFRFLCFSVCHVRSFPVRRAACIKETMSVRPPRRIV